MSLRLVLAASLLCAAVSPSSAARALAAEESEELARKARWQSRTKTDLLVRVPDLRRLMDVMQIVATPMGSSRTLLGRGEYGDVYSLSDALALKIMKERRVTADSVEEYFAAIDDFDREAILMSNLRHERVTSLLGYSKVRASRDNRLRPMLVMERAEGTFKAHLEASVRPDVAATLDLARQALEGIEALSSQGFVHGDVSLDNLFVFGAASRLKLGDFGLTCSVAEGAKEYLGCRRMLYKPGVRPPEVWRAMRYSPTHDAARHLRALRTGAPETTRPSDATRAQELAAASLPPRADVWAMGIVLYIAVFRELPYARSPERVGEGRLGDLCVSKLCPQRFPKKAGPDCEKLCRRWPRRRLLQMQVEWYWGETVGMFRAEEVLPEAGPTRNQSARLGRRVQVYGPLRRLLLHMLEESPMRRCSAGEAAERLQAIVRGLVGRRTSPRWRRKERRGHQAPGLDSDRAAKRARKN